MPASRAIILAVGWLMVLTLLARCFTEAILPACGLRCIHGINLDTTELLNAGY